jgi:short subunit dehydrogenase-like uncharacterized protein
MTQKTKTLPTNKPVVAVFGATGHTGRFVIAELLPREMTPIAIARKALSEAEFPENVVRRQATVDDAALLNQALHGAQAVINCAGPFIDTADAIASAALRAEVHYVDVCAEQISASKTLEKFDEPARKAGVTVVPAVAFYGGLADLMVTAVLGDWDAVDSIEVLMGIDSWHPTQGTRNAIAISRGQDSYAVTAPLACEAVARLLKGNIPPGAHAPGEIFDGKEFLEALGRDHLTLEIATH